MTESYSGNFSIQRRTGRLIEARVYELSTVTQAEDYKRVLEAEVAQLPPGSFGVLCADHRPAEIYPQVVSDRLAELFHTMNERLERVAIIVDVEKATFYMQLRRLVREAGNEARQVFQGPEPAIVHLSQSLDPAELRRAEQFLRGYRET